MQTPTPPASQTTTLQPESQVLGNVPTPTDKVAAQATITQRFHITNDPGK